MFFHEEEPGEEKPYSIPKLPPFATPAPGDLANFFARWNGAINPTGAASPPEERRMEVNPPPKNSQVFSPAARGAIANFFDQWSGAKATLSYIRVLGHEPCIFCTLHFSKPIICLAEATAFQPVPADHLVTPPAKKHASPYSKCASTSFEENS